MSFENHIRVGARLFEGIANLSSHVVVGGGHIAHLAERIPTLANQGVTMADRVIVGGGHEIPMGGTTVQQVVRQYDFGISQAQLDAYNYTDHGANQVLDWGDFRSGMTPGIENAYAADIESRAWDRFMDAIHPGPDLEFYRELGLAIGSAAAGDMQGALEHGLNAAQNTPSDRFYREGLQEMNSREARRAAEAAELTRNFEQNLLEANARGTTGTIEMRR